MMDYQGLLHWTLVVLLVGRNSAQSYKSYPSTNNNKNNNNREDYVSDLEKLVYNMAH